MASIGHIIVGMAVGCAAPAETPRRRWTAVLTYGGLALAPDLDVLGVAAGLPDYTALGHRGFSHSLSFAVASALVLGAFSGLRGDATGRRRRMLATFALTLLAVGSHGLLDAMTFTTRGVPVFWPFTEARVILPWRPIPPAPTGMEFFSPMGLRVVAIEALYFMPLLLTVMAAQTWRQGNWLAARTVTLRLAAAVSLVAATLVIAETRLQYLSAVSYFERAGGEPLVMASAIKRLHGRR